MENQAEAHRECQTLLSLLSSQKKKTKSAQSSLGWTQLEGQSSGHLQAFGLLQDVCECVWM